jgi:hypothetical protein
MEEVHRELEVSNLSTTNNDDEDEDECGQTSSLTFNTEVQWLSMVYPLIGGVSPAHFTYPN